MIRLLLFLIASPLSGQIKVDKAGDGWDLKVDSAINLIKQVDSSKYDLLVQNCSTISFWLGNFSSCDVTEHGGKIFISSKDVKLNSINNLATILVHESLHLYFRKKDFQISERKEENYCYRYELEFIQKLPNPEPWLKQHALSQIENTQK